jgi:hypothetical protein
MRHVNPLSGNVSAHISNDLRGCKKEMFYIFNIPITYSLAIDGKSSPRTIHVVVRIVISNIVPL